jgi:hypothetical protein
MENAPNNNESETKNLLEFFVIFKFLLCYSVNPFDRFHADLLTSVESAKKIQQDRGKNNITNLRLQNNLLSSINESEKDDPTFEFQINQNNKSKSVNNIVPFDRK